MLGWLWRLLVGRFGCAHAWERKPWGRADLYDGEQANDTAMPVRAIVTLRCEKCGDLKNHKLF